MENIDSECVGRVHYIMPSWSGFIASPHYPDNYDWNVDCQWRLLAQRHQSIRITLVDFELDVRLDGLCHDTVRVIDVQPDRLIFDDCGVLGKQTLNTAGHEAIVQFHTGHSGQTRRGFLLKYDGQLCYCCWLSCVM